jgi:hypothetical protein
MKAVWGDFAVGSPNTKHEYQMKLLALGLTLKKRAYVS